MELRALNIKKDILNKMILKLYLQMSEYYLIETINEILTESKNKVIK